MALHFGLESIRNRGLSTQGVSGVLRKLLAVATFGAVLGGAVADREASAYSVKKTSRGELVHWDEPVISYALDPSIESNVEKGTSATAEAIDSWSGTVGAPDLVLNDVAAGGDAAANAPKKPGFDRKNGVFYMKDGYAPAGRALAITILTYDNASGRILDADVVFNGSYKFEVLAAPQTGAAEHGAAGAHPRNTDSIAHDDDGDARTDTVYDLHHVIAHEIGHSLGMNDELDRRDALMYRYSAPNDATIRSPASDDIAGLAELYSTQIQARGNGCSGATVAAKKPTLAASHAALLATLGLLFFLTVRAKRDRRARVGFVAAVAVAAVALLPSTSKSGGVASAQTSVASAGHARARIVSAKSSFEQGIIRTTYELTTTACRAAACPKAAKGAAWGGTVGDIRQEVGNWVAPASGDDVDVSFSKLPSALAPVAHPLGSQERTLGEVAVLTAAR